MAGTILLIAQDASTTRQLQAACDELEVGLDRTHTFEDALTFFKSKSAELVVCDFGSFEYLRTHRSGLHVVLIADTADSGQAIESMKYGALDYLVKPLDHEELVQRIGDALRNCRNTHHTTLLKLRKDSAVSVQMVGQSPAMQEVYKLIGLIASRDINVLITGESGTGKELVASAIWKHSQRHEKPFLPVNCAAIPETLLESELFGHEKGAFTGADARRIGKFEECHGGTLFLDEVGDIPPATQAKLLRVLQNRTFQRLGSNEVVHCDVRVIAATNQPLEELIAQKTFREDLYYRLKVATIQVPPLREREVDVVLLAHHFVAQLNHQFGTQVQHLAPEAISALLAHHWPGNVRELENMIKEALVVARGSVLRLDFLPGNVREASRAAVPFLPGAGDKRIVPPSDATLRRFGEALVASPAQRGQVYATALAALEKAIIRVALNNAGGQLVNAAQILGLSRTTLRKKMRKHGIHVTATAQDKAVPPLDDL